ncbi:MAG: hypothetical protein M3384_08975 [Acidobacteriota bacterium]|nr:hypothetical protein [Acidobacteriota bacterium]
MKNKLNILLVLILLLGVSLACNRSEAKPGGTRSSSSTNIENQTETRVTKSGDSDRETRRLDSYSLRGLEFIYYKIPADLSREELIETAQKLHEEEPKAQLILVDDDSQVEDYVKYAKAVSSGDYDAEFPKQWAEDHIVANVQKLLSGKWMLYESYGYKEIAELK